MIYSMISIDTECDKDKNWNIPRPLGFENIHSGVQNVLHPVFMETESIPTYLLSPEIILSKACVDTFSGLPGRFELGTHLHSEFIEPESEPEAVGTFQFQGDLPEPIEQAKLTRLTEIFEKAFGYRPTSFRAGRFGIGPRTLRFLADLGYLVDSSVFPLRITPTKNRQNNFYHLDSTAFFPNLDDYSRGSGNSHLLEVPLTVHSDFFLTLPVSLRKWVGSRELLVWAASKALGRNRVKTLTLRPSTNSVKVMRSVVDRHLDYCENENHIFLNMMFHSNEITPRASPICQTDQDVEAFLDRMRQILIYIKSLGARPAGLSDAWFAVNRLELPSDFSQYYSAAKDYLLGRKVDH